MNQVEKLRATFLKEAGVLPFPVLLFDETFSFARALYVNGIDVEALARYLLQSLEEVALREEVFQEQASLFGATDPGRPPAQTVAGLIRAATAATAGRRWSLLFLGKPPCPRYGATRPGVVPGCNTCVHKRVERGAREGTRVWLCGAPPAHRYVPDPDPRPEGALPHQLG